MYGPHDARETTNFRVVPEFITGASFFASSRGELDRDIEPTTPMGTRTAALDSGLVFAQFYACAEYIPRPTFSSALFMNARKIV